MIAERIEWDSGRWEDGRCQRVKRFHDVRSVHVRIGEFDGDHFPSLEVERPSTASNFSLHPDGPQALQLFDDDVHDARGSFVVADEEWLKVALDRELYRAVDSIATHRVLGRDVYNQSGVVRRAIERYLEDHVDLREIPEGARPSDLDELPKFEALGEVDR